METLTKAQVVENLRRAGDEIQAAEANEPRERIEAVSSRVASSLRDVRARVAQLGEEAKARTRGVARASDDYAHDNPWTLIGTCAAAGLVIGYLLSRR